MRYTKTILAIIICTNLSFGQRQKDSDLFIAYKANSNEQLQNFIKKWIKETEFSIECSEIASNDTLNNIYGILNSFYQPSHPKTKCIIIQTYLNYKIVDILNKDTLLKRFIFKSNIKDPDSIYKKALTNPDSFIDLIEDLGNEFCTYIKSGTIQISTTNLKFKEKKILPLTSKYLSILSEYLLNNSAELKDERTKRLNFLKREIEFWEGDNGQIRIQNSPANISITMDETFQNALVSAKGNTSSGKAIFKKINDVWVLVEYFRTAIE